MRTHIGGRNVRRRHLIVVLVAWLGSLAAAGMTGVLVHKYRSDIRSLLAGSVIETNLYTLHVVKVDLPTDGRPSARGGIDGRDGGIAALNGGVLVADRIGRTWFVGDEREPQPLGLQIPINSADFESDPYNEGTTMRSRFAVKDILFQRSEGRLRVLASYDHWDLDQDCYRLRVSSVDTNSTALLSGQAYDPGAWTDLFETACVPLSENKNGTVRNPTNGAGGRLVSLGENEVLLSFGGFGPATPDDPEGPYGKTVRIDVATGDHEYFTQGHRNPQGLYATSMGEIWLTEHGERGGDELNRLEQGADYGFPSVSYGTRYESMRWAGNPYQGRHEGFRKPVYAWVPSIGVSQLIMVEGELFDLWRGDLLVSSLGANSLFRVRLEGGHAVFAEPIHVGHRIRDIVELDDGTIALKTDDDVLIFIRPLNAEELATAVDDPVLRGQFLAATCSGCHSFDEDGTDALGPVLWGVVGSPVASRGGFAYSEALQGVGGRWTAERLGAFLQDPPAFAPGTTMEVSTSFSQAQLQDLVAYLETLR